MYHNSILGVKFIAYSFFNIFRELFGWVESLQQYYYALGTNIHL